MNAGHPLVVAEGLGTGGERWTLTTDGTGRRRRTMVILRVAADVHAAVATLSDGTREDLSLHGDAAELGSRVAVLVYPADLDLHALVLLDGNGQELPDTL